MPGPGVARTKLPGIEVRHVPTGVDGQPLDAMIVTMSPGAPILPQAHGGFEYVLVLSGEMRCCVGDSVYVLHRGDSIQFPSHQVHSATTGDAAVVFLMVESKYSLSPEEENRFKKAYLAS